MIRKKIHSVTVILKSCITGTAVWIYRGASQDAARTHYKRAFRREAERIRNAGMALSRRRANIMRMLGDCMSGLPVTGELDQYRRDAARQLVSMADDPGTIGDRAFYDHAVERRRQWNAGRKKKELKD